MITLGLSEILVGTAAAGGTMPGSMAKIGKTYQETCQLNQERAEVTEHFEEGRAAPEVRLKQKKVPVLTFSILDPDVAELIAYVGGTNIGTVDAPKWGMDGSEVVANKAIRVKSEQGLWIDIPNADIEAVVNARLTKKGLFLVDFIVTPMAVTSGKAIHAYDGSSGLTVDPTTLTFTSAADAVGQEITATSTGNVTYAAAEVGADWITVTRALKVVTVTVLANGNSEARSTNVTIVADGLTAIVPVTQAGAS
jgi:hypothetical protein